MESLLQDLRQGLRSMAKTPGFTAVAVLVLALGIGANSVIFSAVDAALLRPLPFPDSDRLVLVWKTKPQAGWPQLPFSYPDFADTKQQARTFQSMAAWSSTTDTRLNLTGVDEPVPVHYALVTSDFFRVLGVTPALGHDFQGEDDEPGAARVVAVSQAMWRNRLGADPSAIGKPIHLDGNDYTVVAVMPDGFDFPKYPQQADVWIPIGNDPMQPDPKFGRRYVRTMRFLGVIGRLAPDATPEQAAAEAKTVAARLEAENPDANAATGMVTVPLRTQLVGSLRPALVVLMAAVGFVLLIACANVANLLLARANARQREIAVRMAIGASRRRVIRQLLTESIILALAGGAAGLLLAVWGVDLLAAVPYGTPSDFVPYGTLDGRIELDATVVAFTLALSLGTGVLFGLAPALFAARAELSDALASGSGALVVTHRGGRFRAFLVATELALSLVLLVGAALAVKSFVRLMAVDPGFEPDGVMTADISLPRSKYADDARVAAFYRETLERIRTLPNVERAGFVTTLPLNGDEADTGLFVEGQPPPDAGKGPRAHPMVASAGAFESLGIPVVEGRAFTDGDTDHGLRVAVVNEALARRFWPGEDPVGKHLALDFEAARFDPSTMSVRVDVAGNLRTVVGVIRDVKRTGLDASVKPEIYVPSPQRPSRDMSLVVRTSGDPSVLADAVRAEVFAVDPDQPIANVGTMSRLVADSVARPRFNSEALGAFAAIALVLASVGLYGVVSYSVRQRTREIGVRMALGARQSDVMRMVLGEVLAIALVGIAGGLGAASALTRVMQSLLFGVSPTDPSIFGGIALALAAVAVAACYVPARRAARIDPALALRRE